MIVWFSQLGELPLFNTYLAFAIIWWFLHTKISLFLRIWSQKNTSYIILINFWNWWVINFKHDILRRFDFLLFDKTTAHATHIKQDPTMFCLHILIEIVYRRGRGLMPLSTVHPLPLAYNKRDEDKTPTQRILRRVSTMEGRDRLLVGLWVRMSERYDQG